MLARHPIYDGIIIPNLKDCYLVFINKAYRYFQLNYKFYIYKKFQLNMDIPSKLHNMTFKR